MANEFFADAGKCEEMLEWCDNRNKTQLLKHLFLLNLFLLKFITYPQKYPHIDLRTYRLSIIQPIQKILLTKSMGIHHE